MASWKQSSFRRLVPNIISSPQKASPFLLSGVYLFGEVLWLIFRALNILKHTKNCMIFLLDDWRKCTASHQYWCIQSCHIKGGKKVGPHIRTCRLYWIMHHLSSANWIQYYNDLLKAQKHEIRNSILWIGSIILQDAVCTQNRHISIICVPNRRHRSKNH